MTKGNKAKDNGVNTQEETVRRTSEEANLTPRQKADKIRKDREARRIKVGSLDDKLEVQNKEDGYHYHWFINKKERLVNKLNEGWEKVESQDEVSAGENSGGDKLILMRIPEEIYKEDKAKNDAENELIDEQLLRGNVKGGSMDNSKTYGSITINDKKQEFNPN